MYVYKKKKKKKNIYMGFRTAVHVTLVSFVYSGAMLDPANVTHENRFLKSM